MPSFDIVSEVDKQEVDNALNQARKELATRFDFKGSQAAADWLPRESKIHLTAEDSDRLQALHEIVVGKLAKRNVDLRNIERKDPAVSPSDTPPKTSSSNKVSMARKPRKSSRR